MVQVRVADKSDSQTISSIVAQSWKSAYRGIISDDYLDSLNQDHWVEFLNSGFENGSIFAMVLEDDYNAIGAAVLSQVEGGDTATLISFYLLPEQIGQGLGHAFYQGIEAQLKQKRVSKCSLDVLEHNERAVQFYQAHGFVKTGRTVNAVLGDRSYLCSVYEKKIT